MLKNIESTVYMLSNMPFIEYLNYEKLKDIHSPNEFLKKSRLIGFIDSGFPVISPIGYKIIKKIEDLIRSISVELGFMEISLPSIMTRELFENNPAAEKYQNETIKILGDNSDYMLMATTEEMMIEYFGKSIISYKQLPMRFSHLQKVFRWLKRPEGFYSSREINFFGFATFDTGLMEYKNSIKLFQILCDKVFDMLNISVVKNIARDDCSVEYLWDSCLGDRTFEKSAATKRDVNRADFSEDWGINDCNKLSSLSMGYQIPFVNKFSCYFNDMQGQRQTPIMGTFGIGLQRVLVAVIEQGLRTGALELSPLIRPFEICIIILGEIVDLGKSFLINVTSALKEHYEDILIDDRPRISLKDKLGLCDILDIPSRIIIGKKEIESGHVEFRKKASIASIKISIENLVSHGAFV